MRNRQRNYPLHGWLGLLLAAIFWFLNWYLEGVRTHLTFFPLWLGYILAIDGLVFMRKGTSLVNRSKTGFLLLFIFSIPLWWLFELFNTVLQNWHYTGREYFSDVAYALYASLNFSTVLPAVFVTGEFVSTFRLPALNKRRWKTGKNLPPFFFISGWVMLVLFLVWPRIFFPFVWISVYFIVEPVNYWLGFKTLLHYTQSGNWRPVWNLWIGVVICGFFWELWNYYSWPKWTYELPYLNQPKIFEMPLAGYLGYLPFSLELFALYNLLSGMLRIKVSDNFIQPE
ncbi:hypothetical protein SAMN05444280_1348 [Tangfeifania diversioriginum]|uniref:Lycopene cyclase domain-containing protein n=1 Tax=Tangfeifania diversioriginum TaxID=1168035 RepID=A0A1M6MMA7_9BACT|nr:hypothetical protein [Tangfeifania diversioriginum]SHJ84423.1 hypothetical protein SAMN05444280_1348 [Tangfeifania diversioriginum]